MRKIKKRSIKKTSLVDQVVDLIHASIFDGKLPPGALISLDDLSKQWGISRTPLREAIRKVEREKLVEALHGRGFAVRVIYQNEVEEIFAVRMLLEPFADALACKYITDKEIEKVERAQQKIKDIALRYAHSDAITNPAYSTAFHKANKRFHFTIYNATRNETLVEVINLLWGRSVLILACTLYSTKRLREVVKEHEKILKALKNRDVSLIREVAKQHLLSSKATALEYSKGLGKSS